jgi:hypothetical protein
MKIRYRILLINFAIVVLIITSSAVAFYSIMYSSLTAQRTQSLTRSANDFVYAYREMLQDSEDDFHYYLKNSSKKYSTNSFQHVNFIFKETP